MPDPNRNMAAPIGTQPAIAPQAAPMEIPDFIRAKVPLIQQTVDKPQPGINAFVRPASTTVHVTDPSQYNGGTPQHEYEHAYENKVRPISQTLFSGGNGADQDYGGLAGLQNRTSIASMNPEQRAQMVGDAWNVNKLVQGAANRGVATPQGIQAFDQWKSAAHPLLRQLKNLGDPGIDTRPEPPGLPPASVSGILAPDSLMGGEWTQVPPITQRKNGAR